jgi:hypothetical protein
MAVIADGHGNLTDLQQPGGAGAKRGGALGTS